MTVTEKKKKLHIDNETTQHTKDKERKKDTGD